MGKRITGKHATHTKYSDYVILHGVQNRETKKIAPEIRKLSEKLGMTFKQIRSRYDALRRQGLTYEDFADYTEQDKKDFDPGQAPISKSPHQRKQFPEGYEKHEDNWQPNNNLSQTAEEMVEKVKEKHPEAINIGDDIPSQEELDQAYEEKDLFETAYNTGHNEGYELGAKDTEENMSFAFITNLLPLLSKQQKVKLIQKLVADVSV